MEFSERLQELIRGPIWKVLNQIDDSQIQLDVQKVVDQLITLAQSEHDASLQSSKREERLTALAAATPDCLWNTDASGQLNYMNQAWQDFTGADLKESLQSGWLNYVDEKDRERVILKWHEHLKSGTPYEIEYRLKGKDGQPRWFLVRGRPVRDGTGNIVSWAGSAIDINEQRRFKEELARRVRELQRLNSDSEKTKSKLVQSESLFRTMCEASPHLIWTCNEEGQSDFFNAQWCIYVGQSIQQCKQEGWLTAVHPDDLERVVTGWNKHLLDGHDYESEVRLQRYDGKFRWHTVRALPIRGDDGKITKWCASWTDIEGHRRLVEELTQARDQAQAVSKLKSEFVANMSHEIRTPMNGILGMVEILLRTELSASAREYALLLKEAGKSLLSILNDILDFSKIEAGRLEISSCEFDPTALIEGVGEILSTQADNKNLLLSTFIDPRIPTTVTGDPLRLRQVLLNLGGNAIKFTNLGSVTIRADLLTHVDGQATIRFSVVDTGIGIPDSGLERLFEPFVQVDGSISRRYGGTGLGLSISKRLIELLGGHINVTSSVGVGSTFSFIVEVGATARGVNQLDTAGFNFKTARSTAVILDDDPQLRDCITNYCASFGLKATACSNVPESIEAIAAARQSGGTVNVIIDGVRNSHLVLELFERELFGRNSDSMRILLLTTKARKAETEALLPKDVAKSITRPIRRSSLKYFLNFTDTHQIASDELQQEISEAKPFDATQLRALVADDNKLNQQVAKLLLEGLNLEVEVVENGMEAVATFDSGKFDIVFLDCQMPELDGYAAARIIKKLQEQRHTHVPVVAMTANALEGSREDCLAAGMDDYLAKPIEPVELEKILRLWSKKHEPQSQADNYETVTNIQRSDKEMALENSPRRQLKTSEKLQLPLVNVNTLAERFSEQNYKQLLSMFAETANSEVETLEKYLKQADFKSLRSVAHSFKGACGTICAPLLANTLQELEASAVISNLSECKTLVCELKISVNDALAEIKHNLLT